MNNHVSHISDQYYDSDAQTLKIAGYFHKGICDLLFRVFKSRMIHSEDAWVGVAVLNFVDMRVNDSTVWG